MSTLFRCYPIALAVAAAFPAFAQSSTAASPTLPEVRVTGQSFLDPAFSGSPSSDSSRLLMDTPGYSSALGGGVSGIPVLNGFADERIKIRVDGMEISTACGNHMNPPLSYTDPNLIGSINLYRGVTPVSLGGDSIGGTIEVKSPAPVFASSPDALHTGGRVTLSARSVDKSIAASVSGTVASDRLSLAYSGSYSRGRSYEDGNGHKVLASMFESNNQMLTLAARGDGQQLVLKVGEQRIPFQGYPNQYMDMTDNRAVFANLTYTGSFAWGKLEARAYGQDTRHEMGFFTNERSGTMPMNTHGRDMGYTVKAELPLQDGAALRLGHEFHRFQLDDWWPPVAGSMMMGPNTFWNINNGERERLVFFGEWEGRLSQQWSALFGVRNERVKTDAGNVQPYSSMGMGADPAAAVAFNNRSHDKRDNNVDLTALARFEPSTSETYEFGFAQKTRSPSLYERYSWGRDTMSMMMNNWFGDGNGYVGDIDLKPEIARTLSFSADWHDAAKKSWSFNVSPFYSHVKNYIDADVIGSFNPYMIMSADGNLLRLANHDAKLYGVNISWKAPLANSRDWGNFTLRGHASFNRGKRDSGGDLYRIMPLTASVALEQSVGNWLNTLETRLVSRKKHVDDQRLEPETAGYAIVNLRTVYQLNPKTTLSAGISNLFDKAYTDPMGGVYLTGLKAAGAGPLVGVPGYGRSVDVGLSFEF